VALPPKETKTTNNEFAKTKRNADRPFEKTHDKESLPDDVTMAMFDS